METLTVNLAGRARREKLQGREYLVAPMTLLVPGVLSGSQGPLYYPPEEIERTVQAWNGMPIVLGHPRLTGSHVSARDPQILDKSGLGLVLKANSNGKLTAEGWFDVEQTRRVAPQVLESLEIGKPLELSTGLFTTNEPAKDGAAHNGTRYAAVARNYRPDHLAILADETGACSIAEGCGVLVNEKQTAGERNKFWRCLGRLFDVSPQLVKNQLTVNTVGDSDLSQDDLKQQLLDEQPREVRRRTTFDLVGNKTKTVDGEELPASAFAYVPDPDNPSTWKLRIDDAAHVGGAVAALGKGYRGSKVSLPADAREGVKRKIRAAWLKYHKGKSERDLPPVLTANQPPPGGGPQHDPLTGKWLSGGGAGEPPAEEGPKPSSPEEKRATLEGAMELEKSANPADQAQAAKQYRELAGKIAHKELRQRLIEKAGKIEANLPNEPPITPPPVAPPPVAPPPVAPPPVAPPPPAKPLPPEPPEPPVTPPIGVPGEPEDKAQKAASDSEGRMKEDEIERERIAKESASGAGQKK